MIIRIRKIQAGKLMITKLYFRAREVVVILPQQNS